MSTLNLPATLTKEIRWEAETAGMSVATWVDAGEMVEETVRRYTVEQIESKIARYRREVAGFEAAYGMQYEVFCDKITSEEGFTKKFEITIPLGKSISMPGNSMRRG